MTRLRILHTNNLLQWGGQSRRILLLAREHQRLGHHVTIAAPAPSVLARRARSAGIEVFDDITFPDGVAPLRAWREIRRLADLFRSRRFDLIDAHCTRDIWMSALAARLARLPAPVIRSRHNLFPVRPHLFNRHMHHTMVAWLIANCQAIADIFLRGRLIPPDRISIIPSAVDLADCDAPRDPNLRRQLGIADDALVVAVSARISIEKGHRDLLEAAPAVLRDHPSAVFLLVGAGPLEGEIRAQAQRRGLERSVVFAGFRDDVCGLLAACDLVVLPSHAEGTPAALLEAQALRRPVVATRVGGIPDIVREGETALLVEPRAPQALAGAISSLLADPARRRAMGQAGRALVEAEFTVQRMAAKTLDAYRSVLEASP